MQFYEKLLTARRLLAISQKEAAEQAGINQAAICFLEKGEKKFIPTEYLQFLYKKGIDINWIIDENNRTDNIFHKNFLPEDPSDKRPIHMKIPKVDDSFQSLFKKTPAAVLNEQIEEMKSESKSDNEIKGLLMEVVNELKKLNVNMHAPYI